ncbi:MAG: polysaccharide deacetylase family protein [Planctomycetota bacterium]
MAKERRGLLGRLIRRKAGAPADESGPQAPAVREARVGLCFDYERGVDFVSESLSDHGMRHILKVLKRYGLRATFNCPAKLCELAPRHLNALADAGHEIAVLGFAGESVHELADDALKQLVYACRNAFAQLGHQPIGFRAPHGHWDERLSDELARQKFRYSAEHDHARHPYVLAQGTPPLLRVPVCTDDRGLLRREATVRRTMAKHHRRLRRAIQRRHFVSVCFHPWILVEEKERMLHWEEWVETAVTSRVIIGSLSDAADAFEQGGSL